jgi:hypothetical protein
MGCKAVVRILVFSSLLRLGTGNGMSRHNYTQSNPTRRPQQARRSR